MAKIARSMLYYNIHYLLRQKDFIVSVQVFCVESAALKEKELVPY